MHRTPLLSLLAEYATRFPDEATTIATYRDFVSSQSACFERSLELGHVTGSAWLVDPGGKDLLLTHHRKLQRWLQLGGHADGDPDVHAVALREAREESGITEITALRPTIFDIDIHPIPARGDMPEHLHFDARFLFQARHRDIQISDESNDLAWVPIEQLDEKTTEESILRMREKWRLEAG